VSFEAEFLTLMPSTISVYEFVTFDNYGDPSYSTAVTKYRCRVEYDPTVMRNQLGQEIVSNITTFVASTSELNTLSRYVLPDGSTGIVQSIAVQWDDEGVHHNVVNFGG